MNDYAGRMFHDDKMRVLYREAAQSWLAAEARPRSRTARGRAVAALRKARVGASGWLGGDPMAHGLRSRLGPRPDLELAKDA
jgi:hypothetical protein